MPTSIDEFTPVGARGELAVWRGLWRGRARASRDRRRRCGAVGVSGWSTRAAVRPSSRSARRGAAELAIVVGALARLALVECDPQAHSLRSGTQLAPGGVGVLVDGRNAMVPARARSVPRDGRRASRLAHVHRPGGDVADRARQCVRLRQHADSVAERHRARAGAVIRWRSDHRSARGQATRSAKTSKIVTRGVSFLTLRRGEFVADRGMSPWSRRRRR